ncbi:50S ribosomal protein L1 [Candidatus Bathyarchaeota archaeon]|nr:MAG: 50S ribosomal protein L1 [Candidatus Bathyarchaeota archaeon]
MAVSRREILRVLKELREKRVERNFKQSIDLIVNLKDLDLRRPENRVNLRVELPHGTGKERKVCVFAEGDLALKAREAGVDLILGQDRLRELSSNRKEAKKLLTKYDVFLAEAPLMPLVGRVAGPILGPRGRMPTPVPPNAPLEQILERQRRTVLLRSRDRPLVQCSVGTEDMGDEEIAENVEAVLSALVGSLRRGAGNIKSIYLKMTMGPPVRLK